MNFVIKTIANRKIYVIHCNILIQHGFLVQFHANNPF